MHPLLAAWLKENGFPHEDVCIVKRIVKRNGKNRVFINGASATLSQLKEITEHLIDLNNQSEHQMLMDPSNHLLFLDYFGLPGEALESYQSLYKELYRLTDRYEHFKREEREIRRKMDTYRFEISEIDGVNPKPGEDDTLLEEVKILEKARSLKRPYDCLVPLSGGKDNTYALYLASRVYKLKTLAVSLDNSYLTNPAKENIQNALKHCDADHIYYTINRRNADELFRVFVEKTGDFCNACMRGINYAIEFSVKAYHIPLIIKGSGRRVQYVSQIKET